MSRSNPTAKNPAVRFMQWRGGAEAFKDDKGKTKHEGGKITWYDKEAEEEREVALPFSFLVLDELNTITGFSEKDHSGFWSNEVRDLKNDKLVVKTKSGTVASGVYEDIKEIVKAKGAKYTKSVYIAFKDEEGEMQIGHLKISGAALTAWIEFQKKFDVMQCAVQITDEPKLEKKGTNYYFSPVFEGQNVSEASDKAAKVLDEQLQQYLTTYLSRRPTETADAEADEVVDDDVDEDENLDEEEDTQADESPAKPAPSKSKDEDKINLADVPF